MKLYDVNGKHVANHSGNFHNKIEEVAELNKQGKFTRQQMNKACTAVKFSYAEFTVRKAEDIIDPFKKS